MKQKLVAMLLILWSYNNQTAVSASGETLEPITIETIVKDQLDHLLYTLKKDDFSKACVDKYNLKGDFDANVRKEIRILCKELEINEEWLYKLFNIESKGNPKAVNYQKDDKGLTPLQRIAKGRAVGLIQWMPKTAKLYNTTTKDLYDMSISEQLPYIKKYLLNVKKGKELESFLDLYLAVFYPHAINKPHDFVLGSEVSANRAAVVAKQNKGIDSRGNKDGQLTKGEIADWVS